MRGPFLVLASVLGAFALSARTLACDPMAADQQPVLDTTLTVSGQAVTRRELLLPASAQYLLLARETGEDVFVRFGRGDQTVAAADSPVRRAAIQHLFVQGEPGLHVWIEVEGKEHERAHGKVELRVISVQALGNSRGCLAVWRSLADADAAYSRAQSASRRRTPDPQVDIGRDYAHSVQKYEEAATLAASSGAAALAADAQLAASSALYLGIGNWAESAQWGQRAAAAYAALGNEYGQARALGMQAAALMELPTIAASANEASTPRTRDQAREILLSVERSHAARGESYERALALNNLGLTYYMDGDYERALEWYRRALPLFEQLQELTRHTQVLGNIALVQYELGQFAQASDSYRQVLKLVRSDRDPELYINLLNNSALASYASGKYDDALRGYGEALERAEAIHHAYYQGVSLHGIGIVYAMLGEQSLALQHFERALSLRTAELDERGRRATLREIGEIQREQGRPAEALAAHEEALTMASAPDTDQAVRVLIAKDLSALGRADEAIARLAPVLQAKVPGNDSAWSNALLERSRYRADRGDLQGADADVRLALTGVRLREAPAAEFTARLQQARLARQRAARADAYAAVDRALALAEEIRMQSANPALRATALQRARAAFDLKISMLADDYEAATESQQKQRIAREALATSEQARARALEDYARWDVGAAGLPSDVMLRRRELYLTLAERRAALDSAVEQGVRQRSRAEKLRTEIASLRRSLDELDAQVAAASSGRGQVGDRSRADALDSRRLPASVAALVYWMGADEAFLWEVTGGQITFTRLGPSSRIERTALDFHNSLRNWASSPLSERLRLSEQLHTQVLGHAGKTLASHRTLIFVPDGALHYIPFATLRAPAENARYLIESHDLALAPSLRALLNPQVPPSTPGKRMLLVADPVYESGDQRLAGTSVARAPSATIASLPRLPGTAREAAAIVQLIGAQNVQRLEGLAATRENFLSAPLDTFRFIHVASHAIADAQSPQTSALILSTVDQAGKQRDGRVLAADLAEVRLQADLVVLSACDTALGRQIAGEGLIGLRYVVLSRGARAVVASLWQLPDAFATGLMQSFYSQLITKESPPQVALSRSMRQMISNGSKDPGIWGAYALTVGVFAMN